MVDRSKLSQLFLHGDTSRVVTVHLHVAVFPGQTFRSTIYNSMKHDPVFHFTCFPIDEASGTQPFQLRMNKKSFMIGDEYG